jgi:HpcH/HpaI aldolase/citrate lyase family
VNYPPTPEFALWTADPKLAKAAVACGIDFIGPDLEQVGKRERQPDGKSLISNHSIECLDVLTSVIPGSNRFARSNPCGPELPAEVERLIGYGVSTIMLPMARSASDVRFMLKCIDGRARLIVLIEQMSLCDELHALSSDEGIHAYYIGTNDLSRSMGYRTRFGAVADGTLLEVTEGLRDRKTRFGFLGFSREDAESATPLPVSPRLTMAAMTYLGASFFMFARSYEPVADTLQQRFARTRETLASLQSASEEELRDAYTRFVGQCAAVERGLH